MDIQRNKNPWRKDFPILNEQVYNKPLIYLDNAATSQIPRQVIDRLVEHYTKEHANIHRGLHYLSERSTSEVENARERIAGFIGAEDSDCIIFTQGTTDSIHLAASGIAAALNKGDAVISTELEHHSNYVPWQQACFQKNASFLVCPAVDGDLDLDALESLLKNYSVKLLAVGHVSNLTGTVNPLEQIIPLAHHYGARVLVDGAQGILHKGVNVKELDLDFYVFSGHKMLAPTGIGVLYGKRECLETLPPVRFGGGMVDMVTEQETTWGTLPHRLEAGTPNISGIIGLGAAVKYLLDHNIDTMRSHEKTLLLHTEEKLQNIKGLHLLGHPSERSGVLSFTVDGTHSYDIASMIDKAGIAVRSGHLCAQPALQSLGWDHSTRISPAFYNTFDEIDFACEQLEKTIEFLRKFSR